MTETLKLVSWYLKRPALYPQFGRMVARKITGGAAAPSTTRDALAWCEQRAITMSEAIAAWSGDAPRQPLEQQFVDVLRAARLRADACPVPMGGPGALDLLYVIGESCQARKVIETGVAFGWSSLAILLSLQSRAGSQLVSVDMPYPNRGNDEYVGCVVPDELKAQWTLLRTADREGVPRAVRMLGAIDLCHYDSDKSYEGRMWAYPRLWSALRPGGVFASDDIQDNVAFRDFSRQVSVEPMVVGFDGKHVGIMTKANA